MCDREYESVISRKKKLYKGYDDCYDFKVKSKYNPESIYEYLSPPKGKNGKRKNLNVLLENGRMHLAAIGWEFWSKVKRGNDEWRYESPSGKRYYSLNTACEAIACGAELNGKKGFEGNVGGFTRRKRNKRKRRRVVECVESGFRGDEVENEVSSSGNEVENEVESSDDEVLGCRVKRLRRGGGFRGVLEEVSSENELEGTGLRRRRGNVDEKKEYLSENELEGTRLRRRRGNVDEKKGVLSGNESDQEGLDRRGMRLRRRSGDRGNVDEKKGFLSGNESESDQEGLDRRGTRLRRKSGDRGNVDEKRELLSENESDQEGLDRRSLRLRRRSGFKGNAGDDSEVRKEKEDIVYSRALLSKNRLGRKDQDGLGGRVTRLRTGGHFNGDEDEKIGFKTPLATRFVDEKSDDEDEDEDEDGEEGFWVKSKKRTIRSVLDGHNMSRVLRSSKRVREIGSSSVSQVPRTVLSWLIESNAVVPRSKVYYRKGNSNDSLMEGRIARDGIRCSCCQELFSLTGFQAHVVGYNICRPAENIYLENGKSLMSCQVELMRQRTGKVDRPVEQVKESKTELSNDCVCTICQWGGNLILCDKCPSSFHADCLNLEGVPEGEWFCPTCCCVVCGISHVDDSLLRCYQCERRYHAHCKKGREMDNPGGNWFCCLACEKMQWGLQQLLGKPILVGQGNLTWTLVKPLQYDAEDLEHCETVTVAENYSKLSVALEVMHECFEPVKDLRTKRDLVEDVVFCRGSNLNRLNFKGFYTVLLERNDELIATALLRIYGEKVAEVPLIGTRVQHRRLGMCRVLMNEIEKNLLNLGVQKLVLPAAPSVVNTWITSFGFSTIEVSDRPQFLGYTFLDFQDTVMCQKLLRKPPMSRLHLSRDMSSFHRQPRKNVEGRSIVVYNEANSSMSEVSHEDQRQGSDTVDQGAQLNDAPSPTEFMNQRRVERDKNSLKFYIRKQDIQPNPMVSQTNYSKLEHLGVRCR